MKPKDKRRVMRFRKAFPEGSTGLSNYQVLEIIKNIANGRKAVNRHLANIIK